MSMTRGELSEFVCTHEHVGTVTAGDPATGPHAAVSVCVLPSCIAAAQRWVHATTGIPADDLKRFATGPMPPEPTTQRSPAWVMFDGDGEFEGVIGLTGKIPTAEAAHRTLTTSKREREREIAAGYVIRPAEPDEGAKLRAGEPPFTFSDDDVNRERT